MPEATFEELMKVRRDECRVHGHIWDAITPLAQEDPVAFICSNCGRLVNVEPNDEESVA